MQVKVGDDIYTIAGNVVILDNGSMVTMPFTPRSCSEFLEWGLREAWFTQEDVDGALEDV
jgi:hypothetical protein